MYLRFFRMLYSLLLLYQSLSCYARKGASLKIVVTPEDKQISLFDPKVNIIL